MCIVKEAASVCYNLQRHHIIALLWWSPVCIVKEAQVCVRSCEDEACWRLVKFVHHTSVQKVERPPHMIQHDHHECACATSLTFT